MKIAAQLYTVRDLLARDFIGTLRSVRSIGYEHVELAGHGPFSTVNLRHALLDCDLKPCSEHCPIERLETDLRSAIDDAHILDIQYIVCPYIPEERRRDGAGWRACAKLLNEAGRICREHSIQLCYHNHSFEFVDLGGRNALELIYAETDPGYLQAELDTYWIQHGGDNPTAWIDRLPNRCPLLHLKDMTADPVPPVPSPADTHSQHARHGQAVRPTGTFAPVGAGILDWPSILAAARQASVQWGIVEQDICPGDPLDCLRISLKNLKDLFESGA